MSLVIFSHGNSFPASTYRSVFRSLRARGHAVRAVEKFGHDPQYPVSNNWPHLIEQLADFAADQRTMNFGWDIANDLDTAIHEIGQHEGTYFFTMDFVEGRTLDQIVQVNVPELVDLFFAMLRPEERDLGDQDLCVE